jgi:hypothetical protein
LGKLGLKLAIKLRLNLGLKLGLRLGLKHGQKLIKNLSTKIDLVFTCFFCSFDFPKNPAIFAPEKKLKPLNLFTIFLNGIMGEHG